MAKIHLVAIDLDGTLLDSHQRLSERNLAALERLLDAGRIVILATARDRASIARLVPLRRPGLYYISSGGAMVFEPSSNAIVWAKTLEPAVAARIVAFLQRYGWPVFVNDDSDYWVDRTTDRVELIERRYDLRTRLFRRVEDVPRAVMRVSLAAPREVLERAAREATAALDDVASVSLASSDWLDVLAPNAGKGPALEWLQSHARTRPDQTLAIGDYDSDLTLFATAAYRVAMANGVDAIRAAATHHTASNDEDGVAVAIEHFFPASGLMGAR